MTPEWHLGPVAVPLHGVFVGLGVLAALVVFVAEARRRGAVNEQSVVAASGALVGGAIGMRLSGWARHLDLTANPSLAEAWQFGSRSILGGLLGAYLGVLVAKRIGGYRGKTGDLFAPAVALGIAVGRIGCHLTEAPGRPTTLPWGIHAPATTPDCPGCLTGQAITRRSSTKSPSSSPLSSSCCGFATGSATPGSCSCSTSPATPRSASSSSSPAPTRPCGSI